MKERGLICKDDEVRAILDGRKTVFRRPVTSMRGRGRIIEVREGSRGYAVACRDTQHRVHDIAYHNACDRSPFGVQGDRLWVREAYAWADLRWSHVPIKYRADGERQDGVWGWSPSSTMPRNLSRILLEVVSVRIERLHAITEEDARREGMGGKGLTASDVIDRAAGLPRAASFRAAFENKWRSFNYTKSHAWSENPFVWRVEFRRAP